MGANAEYAEDRRAACHPAPIASRNVIRKVTYRVLQAHS